MKQEQESAPRATMNVLATASLEPLSDGQARDKVAEEERLIGGLRQVPDQVLQESLQRMQRSVGITARLPDGGEKCRLWLSAVRRELARRQGAGCSAPPPSPSPSPTPQAPPQPPRPHGRQGEPVSQDDETYQRIVQIMCAEPSEPHIANVQLTDDIQVTSSLPDQVETPACPSKQQQQVDVHVIKPKLEPCEDSPLPAPGATEDWETTPLSGDHPFFTTVMSRTHVQTQFQMCIPCRFQRHLPKACTSVTLLCRGKSWAVSYRGDLKLKKLDTAWMDFAIDNQLKINDACVFELVNASTRGGDEGLVFRVQILRGGLPEELTSKGGTADKPIVIAD